MNEFRWKQGQLLGNYKLVLKLGAGCSGEVWSAISTASGQAVALKIFRNGRTAKSVVENEYEMATRVVHPHILKPTCICQISDYWVMEMPLCMGRSMDEVAGYMSVKHIWQLLHDMASALSALHQVNIGHLDVKPSNILYDGHRFLLSDFGSCSEISGEQSPERVISDHSSYRFDSPELIKGEYTVACDIWSLGATVFHLFMGCDVFNGLGGRVQKETSPLPYMRKNLPVLSELVIRCLAFDSHQRPTALEIVELAQDQLKQTVSVTKERSLKKRSEGISSCCDDFWPEVMEA